ncbi:unnamed protein product [Parnassius apollo]|uniref:(apollo) hypothetical protein n=1 Tax=Parnassius apollo TaxID=110799 RepID=A0A8S3X924_PARAO|nr:unnamed protein product [Parnassius apollo]
MAARKYTVSRQGLTVDEILSALECDEETDYVENRIYAEPPIEDGLTDEDSDRSDEEHEPNLNHLGRRLLQSRCELQRVRRADCHPSTSTALSLQDCLLSSSGSEDEEPISSLSSRNKPTKSAPPAKKKRTTLWKKKEPTFSCSDFVSQQTSLQSKTCKDPLQYFQLFFHQNLMKHIAQQTNIYALQKNKPLMVTEDEIYVVLGAMLLSGYVKLPNKRLYFSKDNDVPKMLQEGIRCNRFESILQNLHLNDNSELGVSSDRLYKLRPLLDSLDSDDDVSKDLQPCSPYHKCFATKTPPCVLRKTAMEAEKNYKDIIELTEREKIYTPNVVELIEKLEQKTSVIAKLEEEVGALKHINTVNKSEMETLKDKISKAEEEVRSITSAKQLELEALCKDYCTKLTDWEVTYDTLKKKAKTREEELLSRLEEFANRKNTVNKGITPEIAQYKDASKDVSAVSSITNTCNDFASQNIHDLIADLKEQLAVRDKTILELEAKLHAQNQEVSSLENKTQDINTLLETCKQQLCNAEEENILHKSMISTLNSIIEDQKLNLESATKDMECYNNTIQELQEQLTRKENLLKFTVNDTEIENLIINEEKIIANNENVKNIIQSLKVALATKSDEIKKLKSSVQNNETNDNNSPIVIDLKNKEIQITELLQKVETLTQQLQESNLQIENLLFEKNNLITCQQQLRDKLSESEKNKFELDEQIKIFINELANLKARNQELTNNLNEKKIIETELMAKNSELLSQIEDHVKKINSLEKEIQKLQENYSEMDHLLLENSSLQAFQQQLNTELSECQKHKIELESQIKVFINELASLKERNQELTRNLNETKCVEIELTAKNSELFKQVIDYVKKIDSLEKDIILKDAEIKSNKENNKEDECNMYKLIEVICKIQDITSLITSKNMEYPDISSREVFKTLDDKINELDNIVTEFVDERDTLKRLNIDLKSTVKELRELFANEITTISTEVDKLFNVINDCSSYINSSELNPIHDKLNKIICFDDVQNDGHIEDTEEIDTKSSVNEIKLLCVNLLEKIENIKSTSICNFNSLSETIKTKESEIAGLGNKLNSLGVELEDKSQQCISLSEEKDIILKAKDEILSNILLKVTTLAHELNILDNLSEFDKHINTNNKILIILDQITSHYLSRNSENLEKQTFEELHLFEAKKEIYHLSEQNLELIDNLSNIEKRNSELSDIRELREMRQGNKDLVEDLKNNVELLNALKTELKVKTNELCCMESKVLEWKKKFTDLEIFMKERQLEMNMENTRLKEKCLQYETGQTEVGCRTTTNVSYGTQSCDTKNILKPAEHVVNSIKPNTQLNKQYAVNSPPSLLTISCNKIIEIIQCNENYSKSPTPSCSKSTIDQDISENLFSYCECKKLKAELEFVHNKNAELTNLLQELQFTNENLIKEIEEASGGIKTLLDFTSELQKRILNHRTNLSTLTATTYAENKSLSSQVKFLQHHHTRFHTVCQRDLPELKKQLHELMRLLKEEGLERRLNVSFKRYSLPNPLDSNSILYTFKNESTLDGDLLMLDTNATLATSADNTLTGHDQTCFEVTQTECLFNDVACQTTNYYQISECDNSKMLKISKEENQKLDQLFVESSRIIETDAARINVGISPIKEISNKNGNDCNFCINCEHEKRQRELLCQEHEEITKKLVDLTIQKEDIEKKYNNLSLETPSTEALVRKLHNFEKELENKSKEIEKLSTTLRSTKALLKNVQEENDSLSTQIMESISEVDDLKKELDTVKKLNSQNTQELNLPLVEYAESVREDVDLLNCTECVRKDEHIKAHASREDCNELKEEVTTIKNQLERSNLAISETMDLDESISETNVIVSQTNNCSMSEISEEHASDLYTLDRQDCLNFYIENIGDEKINLTCDVQIIDVMKMLYSKLMRRHENQIENLVNKLQDYEDSKRELHEKVNNLTKDLAESNNNVQVFENKLSILRNNFKIFSNDAFVLNKGDVNAIELFKEKILMVLDTEFSVNTRTLFDSILETTFNKNLNSLNETINKYVILQEHSQNLSDQLETANNQLVQLKSQLTDKVKEYDLLLAQKVKIHEISDAVTRDIIEKEKEFSVAITEGYRKLVEENILKAVDIDTTLSPIKNLRLLFNRLINQNNVENVLEKEKQVDNLKQEIKNYQAVVAEKNKEHQTLTEQFENIKELNKNITEQLQEKEEIIQTQKSLYEDLKIIYNKKFEENNVNLLLSQNLSEEVRVLKNCVFDKENLIQNLQDELNKHKLTNTENENKFSELLFDIARFNEEVGNLKHINESLTKEKEAMAVELEKSRTMIDQSKLDLEKMESDILVLNESIKENGIIIENLKIEAKSLLKQNMHLKEQLDEKCKDLSRLENNIKTHETTAKIQTKMISRLQKQKDDDNKIMNEKDQKIEELLQKCNALQDESSGLKESMATLKDEIDSLKNVKLSLEEKISQLETEIVQGNSRKPRLSIEAITDSSRRRRQSIHDSKRIFNDKPQDHNKMESVFDVRSKPDDFFMDIDENNSSRSTPVCHNKGRDSLQSKHEESDEEERTSRPSSVLATRQRRQSSHDLHRTMSQTTPERHDQHRNKDNDDSKHEISNHDNNNSKVKELQERLSSCQRELEELKEKYRELDEECEICAEYLQERDAKCIQLTKEKTALERFNPDSPQNLIKEREKRVNFAHVAVNTDEDWTNLHSVVVDRMSFDAEVEKNKRLTKVIEELRFNKHELKSVISKMQRTLEEKTTKDGRELEKTRIELRCCKEELEDLKKRYTELDEECETCAQYLKEQEEQCRRLKETIGALETKLEELQDNSGDLSSSVRKKRQALHDSNRRSYTEQVDASTQISEDFLSDQVERDSAQSVTDDTQTKQIKRLKMMVETLSQQKAELEQQLSLLPTAPVYVATGSAIVQNQQLTDVMKENQKLKKMNIELITLCKKRGKALIKSNRENQVPTEDI